MSIIVEDTRQQANKHKVKHESFAADGDTVFRSKLLFGDYALPPSVAVDTKQDILEIAQNMCGSASEKRRFAKECHTARLCESKLVFLIEDGRFSHPKDLLTHTFRLHNGVEISGKQLATAMSVMAHRYGVEFRFCKPADAARIIKEILEDG